MGVFSELNAPAISSGNYTTNAKPLVNTGGFLLKGRSRYATLELNQENHPLCLRNLSRSFVLQMPMNLPNGTHGLNLSFYALDS